MIKKLLKKMKVTDNAKEYNKLTAQMIDLLSDVESVEQLKEACAKDGVNLNDQEAVRMYEQLVHARQIKKRPIDMEELILVNGGAADWLMYPAVGPDGWVKEGEVYRKNNKLYKRGYSVFRMYEEDGCHSTHDGWCWFDDSCHASYYIYDEIYNGDERTDIDPDRMSDAFINGMITGGEDF
jgi:DNA gyrase/topoisomerase IV subunit A